MRIPKYGRHASGKARVRWQGRDHYLPGKFGSAESIAAYEEFVERIQIEALKAQQDRRVGAPVALPADLRQTTVGELLLAFLTWAEGRYDRKEFLNFRRLAKLLKEKHLHVGCRSFGPVALKGLRSKMVALGWARTNINRQVNRIRWMFRWGVAHELVPPDVHAALLAVAPLRQGEENASETPAVAPVNWSDVEAVGPHVPPVIWDMICVQSLCGCRSDELTAITPGQLDMSGDVWIYRPEQHKTKHRGKTKAICLGPRAVAILGRYTSTKLDQCLFRPELAIEWHKRQRQGASRSPLMRKPAKARKVNPRYDAHSYFGAIKYGFRRLAMARGYDVRAAEKAGAKLKEICLDAGVVWWHPHQLRHLRATTARATHGAEGASTLLGNTITATEIYAERSLELAKRIARESG